MNPEIDCFRFDFKLQLIIWPNQSNAKYYDDTRFSADQGIHKEKLAGKSKSTIRILKKMKK